MCHPLMEVFLLKFVFKVHSLWIKFNLWESNLVFPFQDFHQTFRRSPSCRWDQSWSLTQGGCEIHLSDHPKLVERVTKTIIPNLSPKLVKTSHQNNHSKLVKSSHQKVIKVSKSPNRWSTCVFRLLQSGTINKNAIRGMLMICFEIENKNPNIPCQRQQRRSRHRGWCALCAGNRFPPSADAFEQTHCSPSMLGRRRRRYI